MIDHINGDRADNRLANLREATLCENQWNSKVRAHNATGVKGVQIKTVGAYTRYVAIIRANGKKEHLGSFKSLDEAAQAVQKRRMELHEDFARHA
ncbi:hypothetical protein BG61_34185 [Caballeronia glathei]|uniref:HNH nuclease domain-containing protein n=1 Tax=Caballeronia glathei TaxID=60547 RepID=A0A069PPH7_9BURK|nr:hypothetical protein BG61_34185 [Caballeronia glathei]